MKKRTFKEIYLKQNKIEKKEDLSAVFVENSQITVFKKPLSANRVWQGKRFKTKEYLSYEKELLEILPDMELPNAPYHLHYEFGFSNKASDIDNPCKSFTDVLQKRYDFNDKHIYRLTVEKRIVEKGKEYIKFFLQSY